MSKKLSVMISISALIIILSFLKSAHCQTDVKLIAGFEREEAKSWDSLSTYLTFTEVPPDTCKISDGSRDYSFTKGYATQGEFSLTEEITLAEYTFYKTMWDTTREPDGYTGDSEWYIERFGYVFRAFRWFRDVFSKDWSAWDLIWIDVLSTDADAIIRVIIEDRWEASAIRRFEITAGTVSTIKFTLREVATIGEIDLTDMNNIWITLEETTGPTIIYIDNIRLATSVAQKSDGIPFVTDDSQIMKRTILNASIEPVKRDTLTKITTLIEEPLLPISIGFLEHSLKNFAFLGGGGTNNYHGGIHERAISAYDNNRLLLVLNGKHDADDGLFAIGSFDGGKTWKGIDGTENPTFIYYARNSIHHSVFEDSEKGDGFIIGSGYCYAGGGLSNFFFYKISFLGDHWSLSPEIICYNYMRHCPERSSVFILPDSTLWAAFENWSNVQSIYEIDGVFSSKEGEKWEKLGKSPLVNTTSNFSGGLGAGPFLTLYQEKIACIWKRSYDQITWAYCNEGQWLEQGLIDRASSQLRPVSVVTVNDTQIFLSIMIDGKLYISHLDKNIWQKDLIEDASSGIVLRSILTVINGKIPYCIWAQEINTNNYCLFYRRYNVNQKIWEPTQEIIKGETDEIYNLSTPINSPINYIPLLYDSAPLGNINSDEFWLKLIKIPVDTMLAPAIPILASPLKGSSHQDSTIILKWFTAADAATYCLQLDKEGSFLSPFVDLRGISDTASVITHLDPNTTYYWRVIAINEAADSPWSEIWDFNITVVPVELCFFSANLIENDIELSWTTVSETNNYGFEIQRAENKSDFMTIGFLKGFGTSLELHKYTFINKNVNNGIYYYRLKQIDFDGNFEYSKFIKISKNKPETFVLEQNYPNPFNAFTMIKYHIPGNEQVPVVLRIFNVNGKEVKKIIDSEQNPGMHQVCWDATDSQGKDVSNGVYFVVLESQSYSFNKKVIILK